MYTVQLQLTEIFSHFYMNGVKEVSGLCKSTPQLKDYCLSLLKILKAFCLHFLPILFKKFDNLSQIFKNIVLWTNQIKISPEGIQRIWTRFLSVVYSSVTFFEYPLAFFHVYRPGLKKNSEQFALPKGEVHLSSHDLCRFAAEETQRGSRLNTSGYTL